MTELLLSVHVLAAILAIGPIAVAASLFPRHARQPGPTGAAALLHRICGGYAVAAVTVPVFGFATALHMGVLTDAWLLVSIVLTALAAAVLGLLVVPGQRRVMASVEAVAGGGAADPGAAAVNGRLAMATGLFNLLWAVVVVLMIVRPGSTTGA
ncbi:DUF2269 family protein [Streptomyces avicenniae]|uniref:DUF2269 family protein n=1 Tax=Streptomyces avicenniae TaxID=500153 RepID=UPI000699B0D3|nr:DUF2269 family protein [Streptomyces avicenniae]